MDDRHELFCQLYISTLNGAKAAIKAGYSRKTAVVQASRLLAREDVKSRIAQLQSEIAERNKITADKVIQELAKLSFWNIKTFLKKGNLIKDLTKLSDEECIPVAGVKIKETKSVIDGKEVTEVTTELKLIDKSGNLVQLGRHLGIFKEDNKQKKVHIRVSNKS